MMSSASAATTEIYGLGGDDVPMAEREPDLLVGGSGVDFANYNTSPMGRQSLRSAAGAAAHGDAEGDTLLSIENVDGSEFQTMF